MQKGETQIKKEKNKQVYSQKIARSIKLAIHFIAWTLLPSMYSYKSLSLIPVFNYSEASSSYLKFVFRQTQKLSIGNHKDCEIDILIPIQYTYLNFSVTGKKQEPP